MWKKIKELRDLFLLILGGIGFALLGYKAHKKRAAAKRMHDRGVVLMNSGVEKHIEEGKVLLDKAESEKVRAKHARMDAEAQLRKLGETNETLDAIADRFNSRRLRKQPGDNS